MAEYTCGCCGVADERGRSAYDIASTSPISMAVRQSGFAMDATSGFVACPYCIEGLFALHLVNFLWGDPPPSSLPRRVR